MHFRTCLLIGTLAFLGPLGCAEEPDSEPEVTEEEAADPLMDGTWGGSSGGLTLSLTLSDGNQSITGSGRMTAGGESLSVTVSGTHVHPNVSLVLHSSGYEDSTFEGRFRDANTVDGSLHGSGFAGEGISLTRR